MTTYPPPPPLPPHVDPKFTHQNKMTSHLQFIACIFFQCCMGLLYSPSVQLHTMHLNNNNNNNNNILIIIYTRYEHEAIRLENNKGGNGNLGI